MEEPESPVEKPPSRRNNRRDQIVAATEELLRTKGLSGVTTRGIAAKVGCSEAAIYVHFKGRLELLLAVLQESLPDMLGPLRTLGASVGQRTPEENLEAAAKGMMSFQKRVIPMLASLFAEPDVLREYRRSLAEKEKGPHRATATIASYLRSEQDLGRIDSTIDASVAANILVSVVFFQCFSQEFFGIGKPSRNSPLRQSIATILRLNASH